MIEVTSRERVLAALDHREPDRVPVALGGGPYGLVDSVHLRLVAHLALGDPVPPFRSGHNVSHMDDRVLERLGIDTRYVWMAGSPSDPAPVAGDPDTLVDGYGQPWKRAILGTLQRLPGSREQVPAEDLLSSGGLERGNGVELAVRRQT